MMSFCLGGVVVGRGAIDTLLLTRTKMTSLKVWRCYLKEVSDLKGFSLMLLEFLFLTPLSNTFKRQPLQVPLRASHGISKDNSI